MSDTLWDQCLNRLKQEIQPEQFNNWIRPLQGVEEAERLVLLAPNRFVKDWVKDHYQDKIAEVLDSLEPGFGAKVQLAVGTRGTPSRPESARDDEGGLAPAPAPAPTTTRSTPPVANPARRDRNRGLLAQFNFENFVEGKCNQLGRAAAMQVAENPGNAYNPLFVYGGVGLGKTHLMHAVGNAILASSPDARVVYLHSERFVNDMVSALQHNAISKFKSFYRSVDALLIDDIQFFIGKERSQEEFFHTFNALLEDQQQIILTCDRFPRSVEGIEERLKSRFGWGLTVAMEPPELETRVAILKSKASAAGVDLPHEVAFFIAKRIKTNIRELEGALRRVIANSKFTGKPISLEFTREALKDLLALQEKLVTIENIQKTVAEYYKLRVSDLVSKRRSRSIARPRQVAMALAKEVTNHSLPEIGDAFGGRDHTTVLHACRKVRELRDADESIQMDYKILLRTLSS